MTFAMIALTDHHQDPRTRAAVPPEHHTIVYLPDQG